MIYISLSTHTKKKPLYIPLNPFDVKLISTVTDIVRVKKAVMETEIVTHNDEEQKRRNLDEKEKDINDWLPISKSRNAKWWYSAFHNVTAVVGAGVLGFPYAMSELGWYACFCFTSSKF